jgi:BirA family biotin operon repressor/biotin-[acetyl-CoA-carboxylase] ligase
LAIAGAPHGTLVSAAEQTAGRGRQGRSWVSPPGNALLCSFVLRDPPPLLSLIAGVAVCDALARLPVTEHAQSAHHALVKWPNDVVLERSNEGAVGEDGIHLAKLAGILIEGRPQEGWAVLGIGLNVAVNLEQLPPAVRTGAASLELESSAIDPLLTSLAATLERRLAQSPRTMLEAWRARDALRGRDVSWTHPDGTQQGQGRAEGVDEEGHLLVGLSDGTTVALSAGEVHLESVG